MSNVTNLINGNLSLSNYIFSVQQDGSCNIPFQSVIEVCNSWKNQSTYVHSFYIIFVAIYFLCLNIKRFWNPKITYTVKFFSPVKETFTLYFLNEIMDICITIIIFRIIQVWYIIEFML